MQHKRCAVPEGTRTAKLERNSNTFNKEEASTHKSAKAYASNVL